MKLNGVMTYGKNKVEWILFIPKSFFIIMRAAASSLLFAQSGNKIELIFFANFGISLNHFLLKRAVEKHIIAVGNIAINTIEVTIQILI